MNIGSKQLLYTTPISFASYVQSNLVAIWDGVQNTAIGHSSSTFTWKDLCGAYDMQTSSATTGHWEDDGFVFNSDYAFWNTAFSCSSVFKDKTFTAECVYRLDQAGKNYMCVFGARQSGGRSIYGPNYYTAWTGGWSFGLGGDPPHNVDIAFVTNDAYSTLTEVGKTNVFTMTHNGTKLNGYVNGQFVSSLVCSSQMTSDGFSIGRGYGSMTSRDSSRVFSGKVSQMRLYDRALTAEEIAHNYEIDKARFGI